TTQTNLPTLDPGMELQRLSRVAVELGEKLKAHRDMLAQRGMMSPQNSIETLQGVSRTLQTLTNAVGGAQGSEVEVQQLRELARTTELINSTLDLDLVLDEVIDSVISLTGAERGYIVLKDADSGALEFRVARDKQQHDIPEGEFIISHRIVEKVANEGELVVTVNALEEGEF